MELQMDGKGTQEGKPVTWPCFMKSNLHFEKLRLRQVK